MRGGARSGAGRPQGAVTRKTREIAEKAVAEGMTPLDFLLVAMRDAGNEFSVRLDAAKAAAPYVHARLAAVTHQGPISEDGTPGEILLRILDSHAHR